MLQVDWDNDGTYANANANVWGKVIEDTFQCRRGRNFASQRIGRSVAGQLLVQLDNRDGLFDPDNTMSALSGLLGGGRRVQWQVNDGAGTLVTQWTGWLRDIRQRDLQTGFDRVTLRAWGVISLLVNDEVEVEQQTGISVGDAAALLFDAAEDSDIFDASYIHGDREMARWWADGPRLGSPAGFGADRGRIPLGAQGRADCPGRCGQPAERILARVASHIHRC